MRINSALIGWVLAEIERMKVVPPGERDPTDDAWCNAATHETTDQSVELPVALAGSRNGKPPEGAGQEGLVPDQEL